MGTKEELESKACVEKRERLFRKLQTTYDLIKKLPENENVFIARAQKVESDYTLFNEIQDKLARLNLIIESAVTIESTSDAYEDLYYNVVAQSQLILDNRKKDVVLPITHDVKQLRPKLPPIDIPKFKGDLEKFPAFRSLFDTLVHETELAPIQKFSFLKSYLEVPALSVIDHFDFNEENYQAAYDKLVERYTDKRLVGTHYLNKLLQFKPFMNGSSNNLRQFIDVFCVQYESLKALKIPDLADFVVFNLAMNVLDPDTKRLFEDKNSHKDFPTFKDLSLFVSEQYKVASLVQAPNVSKPNTNPNYSPQSGKSSKSIKQSSTTKSFMSNAQEPKGSTPQTKGVEMYNDKVKCPLCKSQDAHKVSSCERFIAMSPTQRLETANNLKLCYACLGPHPRANCRSKFSCRTCKNKNHHTLLHRDTPQIPQCSTETSKTLPTQVTISNEPSTNALNCHVKSQAHKQSTTGLLGTVQGRVMSSTGDWVKCRMVVDPASESSFITESLAQTLRLPRKRYSVDVVGVGSSSFSNNRGCVSCSIVPLHREDPILSVEAIVLQTISSNMPKTKLDPSIHNRFGNIQLADPEFDKPGSIDVLLGVQHYSDILSDSLVHIKGSPAALDTIFGFIIFGQIPIVHNSSVAQTMFTQTPSLDVMLQRFWESEEPCHKVPKDIDEVECERFYQETTFRDCDGKYNVSLPFKVPPEDLGSTRKTAQKRLLSLETRLSKSPEFKKQYNSNLQDYLQQGHMCRANTKVEYLLTHHAVVKESTTTQVRVVFNASEKSSTQKSLNDFLMRGPKLQSDISKMLLSFRMNPVALTGDIKQMYRCIKLNPNDTKYTHLLWRSDCNLPISEYELTTLPFGLTCSPYLAQRTIQQLVSDEGERYPMATMALTSNIYIDDIVCAVGTENDAIQLYNELTSLLGKGGFFLRKYSSNSVDVLSHIPEDHHETPVSFESSNCIKLLGFLWDPNTDVFCYKLALENPVTTKRGVLSQVARIYDINGYLTPVTFWIKYFIQKLWLAGLDWDENLPPSLSQPWIDFFSQLKEIEKIRIPRYINFQDAQSTTIVGFCDASEKGYAACVYFRAESADGHVQVNLLKSKSKVAPLKTVTIPRMELNGALLLSKIVGSLKEFLSTLNSYEIICFTDSTTVLSWLHTPPHQLKTYVSNRVVEILQVLPPTVWKHVSGINNPADVASRGLYPTMLLDCDLWWNGPKFLYFSSCQWPHQDFKLIDPIPETKKDCLSLISQNENTQSNTADCLVDSLLHSCSSLTKVQRVLCYVLRFISNLKVKSNERNCGELTHSELSNALKLCIRFSQRKYYNEEIICVNNKKPIKGFLQHLTPFIDSEGLLMVGGRLAQAPIPNSMKHPYLISRKSKLAELICLHYHTLTLHGGPQLMQSIIQRKFWIPGIRYLLRSIIFKCATCFRYKAKPLEPLMSDVPSFRFKMTRAFVNTGVDLCGPFLCKESKRKNSKTYKCWIVMFICLTTRAVHIDLVSDISTSAFLSSLDRFVARRGLPSSMYSDLGTNFVGAARELKELNEVLLQGDKQMKSYCEERQISWHFNPPSAPSFGGSWESAIKSMKHHLKRILCGRPLTYEEYCTLLAKIEAILNSRPLCPVSSSPSDGFDYLTPGHFLVGAPLLLSRPEEDYSNQPINFRSRWQLLSRSVQDLWRRWSAEYLHTLIQRPKWDQSLPNLSPGHMVILSEKNLPPTSWSIGRVVEVFPGTDGIVRVAKVKTANGTFTRPVNKLCLLPFQE